MIRNRSVTAMRLVITRQGEACSHLACVSLGGPGEPEILAMLYVRGAGASAPLDYDDAVALRDWLSAWIVKQGRVDPPVELDEWKGLDPERLVMLTGPGDHSAREPSCGTALVEVEADRCPECGWASIHTRDCSRRPP